MIPVVEYPAAVCACEPSCRRWNGYGTCQRCGGAYAVEAGPLEPIALATETEGAGEDGRS